MAFTDASLTALRVFREVAERGTLTAAATALGYTQSAVSRQVAALERAAGARLLERRHDGVRLTAAGRLVLRRAAAVVDEVDAAARELAGLPGEPATVRFGWFAAAGAVLVPRALAELRRTRPSIAVTGREDGSSALVRALRAGTLDVALLSSAPPFRAPDTETPPLEIEILTERGLRVAVPAEHPLARGEYVDVADLHGRPWIASPAAPAGESPTLGVWPGLDERPETVFVVRDWLAKLALVAAGCGLTTVPASMGPAVPEGVRVLPVRGGPREQRRLLLARLPGPVPGPVADLAGVLRAVAVGS